MTMMRISLLLLAACASCVQAQGVREWKANFRITDETGQPLDKASVTVFYDRMAPPSIDSGKISGSTDTNGVFTASHRDKTLGLTFAVAKDGYYSTSMQTHFHRANRPGELNQSLSLVLKRIGKPIAMHAKSVNLGMPFFDKVAGFDFTVGDWVAPFGKGVESDILFQAHLDRRSELDADYTLTVSFPKAGDGIQEFSVSEEEKGSALRSPHQAPKEGYLPTWIQTRNRKPSGPETGNFDANRNYIIRVRTVLDDRGRILSACYGKIYGDFLQFTYYLNPTPNDRNIEFNPKQNLLGGLQSFEQVSAP